MAREPSEPDPATRFVAPADTVRILPPGNRPKKRPALPPVEDRKEVSGDSLMVKRRAFDESRVDRDRRGRFADIPGAGDDAPAKPSSQVRLAVRADDARRTQGQNPSNFPHPVTGHLMSKSEIGDTYEALFNAHGGQMLVAKYGDPPYTMVARAGGTGSRTTPLDFTVDHRAGELKSLNAAAPNQKTAMAAASVRRKEEAAAEAGLDPLLVVQVIDQPNRTVQVYVLEAFASKAVSRMTPVGEYAYSLADFESAQKLTGHHGKREQRAQAQGLKLAAKAAREPDREDEGSPDTDEDRPAQPGDRVIELRDGVPHVYTEPEPSEHG